MTGLRWVSIFLAEHPHPAGQAALFLADPRRVPSTEELAAAGMTYDADVVCWDSTRCVTCGGEGKLDADGEMLP